MSFDFPSPASEGQFYTPLNGPQYVYVNGAWRMAGAPTAVVTAETRNRIVNGAMQISQENARVASTAASYFPADQWQTNYSVSGAAPITATSLYHPTDPEAGNQYWLRLNNTTADASLAAGDYYTARTFVEGINIADFMWGTANALPAVLRFRVHCNFSGTFCVAVRNGAADRVFTKNCTVVINTPTTFTISIPPITTGTWVTDNTLGLQVIFTIAAGSSYTGGVDGQWTTSGPNIATPQCSNWLSATGQTFDITNVGLYLDPLATGIAPPWQMPDEAEELRACQRYWQSLLPGGLSMPIGHGFAGTTTSGRARLNTFAPMRAVPSLTGTITWYQQSGVQTPTAFVPYLAAGGFVDVSCTLVSGTSPGVLTGGSPILNARM